MRRDNVILLVVAYVVMAYALFSSINALAFGALAGLAVACGGAIKDAPSEGFSLMKFQRSIVAGVVGSVFLNYLFVLAPIISFLASIGFERCVIETYKIYRAKAPMKFRYGEWGQKI